MLQTPEAKIFRLSLDPARKSYKTHWPTESRDWNPPGLVEFEPPPVGTCILEIPDMKSLDIASFGEFLLTAHSAGGVHIRLLNAA